MHKIPDTEQVITLLERGNRRGLAKAITYVENGGAEKEILLEKVYEKAAVPTLTVGITGAGGAGKSTLIDKLAAQYRSQGKTVGILAVDPTSPYSGGAFLGDRVRMSSHNSDPGVFIRSFGSRNCLGGISEAAKNALYLYKAYGFDVIILESLGVGQDETEISRYVDVNTVVLVPGLGDAMQMAKAGV
ncbi:MAG: methylmalonyl Co-A mutase-associated GTPase MeaB, partial [Clostridia bacterium]|nr:methylmalonyl Co-A mutase-associated GTPase MeaB [Clostridia bacterium]